MTVAGAEPSPANPDWPRYSSRPFPAYRFVPGHNPHPRRHPQGHSFGCPEPNPRPCRPDEWSQSEDYRVGIDLYNFAYWWECHEVFEGFWHAVGRKTKQGLFFQALIQLAAANLKHFTKNETAASRLLAKSLRLFAGLPDRYMGIDIAVLRPRLEEARTPGSSYALLVTLESVRDHPTQA